MWIVAAFIAAVCSSCATTPPEDDWTADGDVPAGYTAANHAPVPDAPEPPAAEEATEEAPAWLHDYFSDEEIAAYLDSYSQPQTTNPQ